MINALKVLVIIGTRPEAIKMAPLIKELKANSHRINSKICLTAQHRQMLDQVMDFFELKADYDLNLMKPGQNLYSLTSDIILGLKSILEEFNPDFVFVHGDTTTSMAASIAAFYAGAKVCHVEAGLRTFNKLTPFPEEINRSITGRIADVHFAPTQTSRDNLIRENIGAETILITGNTVIDALLFSVNKQDHIPVSLQKLEEVLNSKKDIVLVTGHRRENFGDGFLNICRALSRIAKLDNVEIIYPVHLNPNVQKPVFEILSDITNIHLIDPLAYEDFVWLMNKSKLIITDSGGVQEEAPSLGKPVLVMRETTERPEAVQAGTVILVGTDQDKIVNNATELLQNPSKYNKMSHLHNPYGDGQASKRIISYLLGEQVNEYQ